MPGRAGGGLNRPSFYPSKQLVRAGRQRPREGSGGGIPKGCGWACERTTITAMDFDGF